MKYAIVFAIIVATYSFSQCFRFLTEKETVGALHGLYCRVTFLHFLPRSFSPVDPVIHFLFWIVLAAAGYQFYRSYIRGRFF